MLTHPHPSATDVAPSNAGVSASIDAAFASPAPPAPLALKKTSQLSDSLSSSTRSLDSLFSEPWPRPLEHWLSHRQSALSDSSESIDSHFKLEPCELIEPSMYSIDESPDAVITAVTHVLESILRRSDSTPRSQASATIFDAAQVPELTVRKFLDFVIQERMCPKECLIISLIYCDRLALRHPSFAITRYNVHRLLLALLIVSAKVIDDFYCRNSFFAQATRISVQDVNAMELQLCYMLNFSLHVDGSEFLARSQSLRDRMFRARTSSRSMATPFGTPPVTPLSRRSAVCAPSSRFESSLATPLTRNSAACATNSSSFESSQPSAAAWASAAVSSQHVYPGPITEPAFAPTCTRASSYPIPFPPPSILENFHFYPHPIFPVQSQYAPAPMSLHGDAQSASTAHGQQEFDCDSYFAQPTLWSQWVPLASQDASQRTPVGTLSHTLSLGLAPSL